VHETTNNVYSSISFCWHKVSQQYLTWGTTLKRKNVIFSQSKNLWKEKYPSRRLNHFSTLSTSILPSNIGISKFICTLKGETPPLKEDASFVGSFQRICEKVSIISFLFCARDSSRKNLKGSPTSLSLFSSTMGGRRVLRGQSCKGSIGLIPN
jgi:hypothetical protein